MPTAQGEPAVLRSPSPDVKRRPDRERDHDGERKRPMTAADIHRRHLEKLLANPTQHVHVPNGPERRLVKTADDITLRNVSGSSSAAGSGEFHLYKSARRREAERVRRMDLENKALAEQQAFMDRRAAANAAAEAKTAKNRARRQKRKGGAKKDEAGSGAGEAKSKFGASTGAGVIFRRPGERDSDDDDGTGDEAGPEQPRTAQDAPAVKVPLLATSAGAAPAVPAQPAVQAAPVASVAITIVDDD
ncbi:hypothetical protein Q5752_000662 [Cryptotrichosporon argae]